jgi:hypothetical protein
MFGHFKKELVSGIANEISFTLCAELIGLA